MGEGKHGAHATTAVHANVVDRRKHSEGNVKPGPSNVTSRGLIHLGNTTCLIQETSTVEDTKAQVKPRISLAI